MAPDSSDPFDDVLNLEERFYTEGYDQGVRDGTQAGKIEGRSVGLAKGFDKFLESGRLYSKSVVWANRIQAAPSAQSPPDTTNGSLAHGREAPSSKVPSKTTQTAQACSLPPLAAGNARLEKNVVAVHALVEPETLSTENTDDAVNDFDDRVRRAQGKVKIIERMIGEPAAEPRATPATV